MHLQKQKWVHKDRLRWSVRDTLPCDDFLRPTTGLVMSHAHLWVACKAPKAEESGFAHHVWHTAKALGVPLAIYVPLIITPHPVSGRLMRVPLFPATIFVRMPVKRWWKRDQFVRLLFGSMAVGGYVGRRLVGWNAGAMRLDHRTMCMMYEDLQAWNVRIIRRWMATQRAARARDRRRMLTDRFTRPAWDDLPEHVRKFIPRSAP